MRVDALRLEAGLRRQPAEDDRLDRPLREATGRIAALLKKKSNVR